MMRAEQDGWDAISILPKFHKTLVSQKLQLLPYLVFNVSIVTMLFLKFVAEIIHLLKCEKVVFHSFHAGQHIQHSTS